MQQFHAIQLQRLKQRLIRAKETEEELEQEVITTQKDTAELENQIYDERRTLNTKTKEIQKVRDSKERIDATRRKLQNQVQVIENDMNQQKQMQSQEKKNYYQAFPKIN